MRVLVLAAVFVCSACSDPAARPESASAAVSVAPPAPVVASAVASAATASAAPSLEPIVVESPRAAFEAAIASRPRIVGVGEAHTQKAGPALPTTAKRFTLELLPALSGRASDLLVELMLPPKDCEKKTAEVREAHKPVTEKQAESNQNDYVAMGEAARKLGVVPDLLRPSCADLAKVAAAGADAVPASLELIKALSVAQTKKLYERANPPDSAPRTSMIVLYGGALHNDREPTPERRAWAYGPDVAEIAKGRYVEIDLFAADAIGDDELWTRLPWRAHYDKAKLADKTTLFRLRDDSFVIVLPASK